METFPQTFFIDLRRNQWSVCVTLKIQPSHKFKSKSKDKLLNIHRILFDVSSEFDRLLMHGHRRVVQNEREKEKEKEKSRT